MAEIKNSFLRSKMNKDLDDRLVPNGEYRDAQNISVGKSEDDDIGALETVLGNAIASNFGNTTDDNLKIIGYKSIKTRNSIIAFFTDYNDSSVNSIVLASPTAKCYIYEFTSNNNGFTLLAQGSFLNFSQTNQITGVSVIENLLFWTDNRNQPRKLNIDLVANGTYYTKESDISVAKYNPYQPISFLEKTSAITTSTGSTNILLISDTTNVKVGMAVVAYGNATLEANDYIYVVSIVANTSVTLNANVSGITSGDKIYFLSTSMTGGDISPLFNNQEMPLTTTTSDNLVVTATNTIVLVTANPSIQVEMSITGGTSTGLAKVTAISVDGLTLTLDIIQTIAVNTTLTYTLTSTWPGDPNYLESRYVRLSYRFEFDDGEYSLMAPFTQIAFIPKQKGYFLEGDEIAAYRSTIVDFMENGVQNVELFIPFPDQLSNVQPSVPDNPSYSNYKIRSLDILYKESDGLVVKVIDTINFDEWTPAPGTTPSDVFVWNYQSKKPFRTLTQSQTTRVYDKVPVKAFAQETAGNRIIYGNFKDKYTPPSFLQYEVGVGPKSLSLDYDNWVEYPNHSLKQNRNYQVGFVLADKFGRQSDVIISSITATTTLETSGIRFGGDTVYNPYNTLIDNNTNSIRNWFGDALKVRIDTPITSGIEGMQDTTTGEPGLYANQVGNGFDVAGSAVVVNNAGPTYFYYLFTPVVGTPSTDIPSDGGINYLRGEYKDFVEITQRTIAPSGQYSLRCNGPINKEIYESNGASTQVKYGYTINPAGWYSYKVVVKQQEQDYYNVYLPGIVNGYFSHTEYYGQEIGETAFSTLYGDNINKVPRDLSEVGPEQKQYRSSVLLSGRVTNDDFSTAPYNSQYFPGSTTHSVDAIATESVLTGGGSLTKHPSIYQNETDPYLVRISTGGQNIGQVDTNTGDESFPTLSIYETDPDDSLLDIFWETTTSGLIADLNQEILTDFNGPVAWETYTWNQFEIDPSGTVFITGIQPLNSAGVELINTEIISFTAVDGNGDSAPFTYTRNGDGAGTPHTYDFSTTSNDFIFNNLEAPRTYTITTVVRNITTDETSGNLSLTGALSNTAPIMNGNNAPFTAIVTNNTQPAEVLATLTGENGALNASLKLQELKWSIIGGDNNSLFTIDPDSGELSIVATAITGVYNLQIQLEDTWNGSTLAAGSLVANPTPGYVIQKVTVNSTTIGYAFTASDPGVRRDTCTTNGDANSTCGQVPYYDQSPLPIDIGHEIRTGPDGTGSPLAIAGYYQLGCDTGTGNRQLIFINNANGIISDITYC